MPFGQSYLCNSLQGNSKQLFYLRSHTNAFHRAHLLQVPLPWISSNCYCGICLYFIRIYVCKCVCRLTVICADAKHACTHTHTLTALQTIFWFTISQFLYQRHVINQKRKHANDMWLKTTRVCEQEGWFQRKAGHFLQIWMRTSWLMYCGWLAHRMMTWSQRAKTV